jgi:predicted ATPase/class 3 adenylate cyclase
MENANFTAPTGTVALLFTDIEGSTSRWEADPSTMSSDLARHDLLLRKAIEDGGGYVFKTVGDAFCAAFPDASGALSAAIAGQRNMGAADWGTCPLRVRMGIHAGEVEFRENDYFGPTVNRVARLCAAGHGGQILLSEAARALVMHRLPAMVGLADLGIRRLKDLPGQERIYQAVVDGLEACFPPLKTLDARPTNLPAELTSFVGREKELATASELLETTRLLCFVGPGGSGKTRLALRLAASLADRYEDGLWFADLAPLARGEAPVKAVVAAMGLRENASPTLEEGLAAALSDREDLLIIDNCEHIVESVASLAGLLLARCPKLHILATSREPLEIEGEVVLRLQPLAAPPSSKERLGAVALSQYDSVRLFIDRARAANPGFAVDDANAPDLAEICWQLDGIPLAIELAAARIRVMSLHEIGTRLADRFVLLRSGSRTALPRQKTLRALIDWSWELLDAKERETLAALSILRGSFDAETVEELCGRDSLEAALGLVEKSLVSLVETPRRSRYRLLETVREYAAEKLDEAGRRGGVEKALVARYARFTAGLSEGIFRRGGAELLATIAEERPNIVAALDIAAAAGDPRAPVIAGEVFYALGFLGEFDGVYERLAPFLGEGAPADSSSSAPKENERVEVFLAAARAAITRDNGRITQNLVRRALSAARTVGDRIHELRCLTFLATALRGGAFPIGIGGLNGEVINWDESLDLYKEAEALARRLGDTRGLVEALGGRGVVSLLRRDDEAETLTLEAAALAGESGNVIAEAWLSHNLAVERMHSGRYIEAIATAEGGLARARNLGEKQLVYMFLALLGDLHCFAGDFEKGCERHEEGLRLARSMGMSWAVYQQKRDLVVVRGCMGEAEAFRAALDSFLETMILTESISREEKIEEILLVASFGPSFESTPEQRARFVGAIEEGLRSNPFTSFENKALDLVGAELRNLLGEESYRRNWEEGRAAGPHVVFGSINAETRPALKGLLV